VRVAPMRSELRLLGTTVARRHITLRAPAAGRVLGLNLQSGDRVRRGEVVAHIINREIEAALSGLEVAKRFDPGHADELEKAVRRYAAGPGIEVRAPEAAIVAQRLVSAGQIVADFDPLVELIDPAGVYVQAAVPIDDSYLIKSGMDAIVTSQIRPGIEFHARMAALSPSFEANSATVPARFEFTGEPRIEEAGAAVEVRVITASVPDATVVPSFALFQDAERGGFYVFVAGSDGLAHRVPVTIGIRTTGLVQVLRGLSPGQFVITSGGYALSDGLKVHVAVAQN
ncbi:MAG: efflux RND transporter periplasmic adaptor subunit, partial [Candidatus Binataceae bacterium]